MLRYIFRRLAASALLILGLLALVFVIAHAAPGDPLLRFVTPEVDPAAIAAMRERLGLDRPVHEQFLLWARSFLFEFDFGVSITTQRPVSERLVQAIPNTLRLTLLAFVLRIVVGVALGIVGAARSGGWLDRSLSLAALVVYSMPAFWLALMTLLLFAFRLQWLPAGQISSLDHATFSWAQRFWDNLLHMVLPVLVLAASGIASTARYMRASLLEVLAQDYVRTARAKGLNERHVVLRHALRNALLPIATLVGLSVPSLLGGALVVEHIFSWPGMGQLTLGAIFSRDYPVVLATTFLAGVMVVLGNLLADVLYVVFDPRIRLES